MALNSPRWATGGLISYGIYWEDQFRRAAEYVDRILKGAKPGDLPVQNPTRFKLVVNLTTAKALGLNIPETVLACAAGWSRDGATSAVAWPLAARAAAGGSRWSGLRGFAHEYIALPSRLDRPA